MEGEMLAMWVKVRVKPQERERFLKAIEVDALGSERDEPGCFRFNVLQDGRPERLLFLRGLPRPGGARGPPRRPALCGLARRCRYPRRRPGSDALPIGVSGGKRLLGAQERPAPLSGASGVAVAPGGAALALQIEFENRGLRPRTADQHIAPAIGVGQDLVAMVGLARAIGGQTGPAIAEFARRL